MCCYSYRDWVGQGAWEGAGELGGREDHIEGLGEKASSNRVKRPAEGQPVGDALLGPAYAH